MMGLLEHSSIIAADKLSSDDMRVTPKCTKKVFIFFGSLILCATMYVFLEEGLKSVQHGNDMKRGNIKNMLKQLKEDEKIYADMVRPTEKSKEKNRVSEPKFSVLTLGGSVTYGYRLESREKHGYPNVLHNMGKYRVTNVGIRASSPFYPSLCIQSIIEKQNGYDKENEEEYDVIIFEFSHTRLIGIDTLVKRLQYRYPNAVLIYLHLYSLRATTQIYGSTGEMQWNPKHEHLTRGPGPAILGLFEQVQGYVLTLPRSVGESPDDGDNGNPYWALPLFQSDMVHLSPRGHQVVADRIAHVLDHHVHFGVPTKHRHSRFDGGWGYGDRCVSWFRTGDLSTNPHAPQTLQHYTGAAGMVRTPDNVAWALRFDWKDRRNVGTITVHNDQPVDVPLFLSFLVLPSTMTGNMHKYHKNVTNTPSRPPVRARIGLSDGSIFDLQASASKHATTYEVETVDVGNVPRGTSIITISPMPTTATNTDATTETTSLPLTPLLLVGVELFGFRYHRALPFKKMHNRISLQDAMDIVV